PGRERRDPHAEHGPAAAEAERRDAAGARLRLRVGGPPGAQPLPRRDRVVDSLRRRVDLDFVEHVGHVRASDEGIMRRRCRVNSIRVGRSECRTMRRGTPVGLAAAIALLAAPAAAQLDFRAYASYATGKTPRSPASGDFDEDGRPDLAVADSGE